MNSTTNKERAIGERAIVLGASISGLMAARVLSERFGQVFVLERDLLPKYPAARKGTPQVAHAHVLLARGRSLLEELFPGFSQSLVAQGGCIFDTGSDVELLSGGHLLARAVPSEKAVVCSRLLIEHELRQRVQALPNVHLLTRIAALEPIYDSTLAQVSGVRMTLRDSETPVDTGPGGALAADFVVDCTGRASHAPKWLQKWGYAEVAEERVEVNLAYATAHFERLPHQSTYCASSLSTPTAARPFGGVLIAQEPQSDDQRPRWVLTLGGYGMHRPEPTMEHFRSVVPHLGSRIFEQVVRESAQLGTITRYGFPYSQRRRYEWSKDFPGRFLVMGDAIASFNPLYGQGMSVAACEASALRSALSGDINGIHRGFFRAAAAAIDTPWQIAVGADLSIPGVEGPRRFSQLMINRYMQALFRAARIDARLTTAFRDVTHLMSPPASLLSPANFLRVVRGNLISSGRANRRKLHGAAARMKTTRS